MIVKTPGSQQQQKKEERRGEGEGGRVKREGECDQV